MVENGHRVNGVNLHLVLFYCSLNCTCVNHTVYKRSFYQMSASVRHSPALISHLVYTFALNYPPSVYISVCSVDVSVKACLHKLCCLYKKSMEVIQSQQQQLRVYSSEHKRLMITFNFTHGFSVLHSCYCMLIIGLQSCVLVMISCQSNHSL